MDSGYTGGSFDSFDPLPPRASVDVITSDDLVAVSLLSAYVSGRAAMKILERQASRFRALLAELGPDRNLVFVESTARTASPPRLDAIHQKATQQGVRVVEQNEPTGNSHPVQRGIPYPPGTRQNTRTDAGPCASR